MLTGNTIGSLDNATRRPGSMVLRGWAIDPDTTAPVPIHVYVDGVGAAFGTANTLPRRRRARHAELRQQPRLHHPGPRPGRPPVCAYAISTRGKPNPLLGCARTSGAPRGVARCRDPPERDASGARLGVGSGHCRSHQRARLRRRSRSRITRGEHDPPGHRRASSVAGVIGTGSTSRCPVSRRDPTSSASTASAPARVPTRCWAARASPEGGDARGASPQLNGRPPTLA